MADTQRVVILGGHGKVALLAASTLKKGNYAVDSIIRTPAQGDAVRQAGGNPLVIDIELAGVGELASTFAGAAAVVFSAGAGGGNPERTNAVDFEAATRAMAAAEKAAVKRFIMVSYAGSDNLDGVDPDSSFYPYAKAKHDADATLRRSSLDYTILGPALLTEEPASGKMTPVEDAGDDWPEEKRVTSRANVAQVIAHVIKTRTAVRQTVNFYDGDTPIAEAIRG